MRNILTRALTVIPRSRFKYRKANGNVVNDFGQKVQSYGEWMDVTGIVQPGLVSSFGSKNISDMMYRDLGLDPSKRTITVWIEYTDISSTANRQSCDQVQYMGKTFNILQVEDWLEYNGWKRCYCQEVQRIEEDVNG